MHTKMIFGHPCVSIHLEIYIEIDWRQGEVIIDVIDEWYDKIRDKKRGASC